MIVSLEKVYVVLWDNYGDQGVDFLGTFSSREKAAKFTRVHMEMIAKEHSRKTDENELTCYSIVESIVS